MASCRISIFEVVTNRDGTENENCANIYIIMMVIDKYIQYIN